MPANDRQWKAYELVFDAITALSDDKQCYQLSEKTVAMLLSQTGYLHWFTRWNKLGGLTADDKSTILELAGNAESELLNGGICDAPLPDESDCFDYKPDAPFIQYAPQDPFSQPDTIPDGYSLPPFYHNPLIPLPGVLPDDAMVNFASIPIFANLIDLLASGFPRIRLNLRGEGRVTVTLVSIVQGGVALITTDSLVDSAKLIDLNYFSFFDASVFEDIFDIVIGGVSDNIVLHEIDITGVGEHTVDITFLPSVSATEILGFGGGLRQVELCGFAELGDYAMPEFTIDSCILKWRPNSSAAWTDLGNVCGADGSNGADGLTPLITADDSVAGVHTILLALSDAPTDTVVLTTILDGANGADGECPDCPPQNVDTCRYAYSLVDAMWLSIEGMLNDLQAYKDANPDNTYIQASDAIYPGLGFSVRSEAVLTDFIQSIYDGDGIAAFNTLGDDSLSVWACALNNVLTSDYINDTIIGNWQDCLASVVSDSVSFMLLMPTLVQFRTWADDNYSATPPQDCSDCDDCSHPYDWLQRWSGEQLHIGGDWSEATYETYSKVYVSAPSGAYAADHYAMLCTTNGVDNGDGSGAAIRLDGTNVDTEIPLGHTSILLEYNTHFIPTDLLVAGNTANPDGGGTFDITYVELGGFGTFPGFTSGTRVY